MESTDANAQPATDADIVALLGEQWEYDLADSDAFAGITAVIAEAATKMADECAQTLGSGQFPRIDHDAQAAAAAARANGTA